MYIIMTGSAGDAGAARMLRERHAELAEHFPGTFLAHCAAALADCVPVTKAGVLEALWQLGKEAGVGFQADLFRIPILQETVEICEYLGENPYETAFSGKVFFYDGTAANLPEGTVIGETTKEKARVLLTEEGVRYLNPDRTKEAEI